MLFRIGWSATLALAWLFSQVILVPPAFAQDSTATVFGTLRDDSGRPVSSASIIAPRAGRDVSPDAQGRFELPGLPAGSVLVRVRAIGYQPAETTFSLRPAERRRWQVVLHEPAFLVRARQLISERAAAGGLDSVGAHLVATDTSAAFTYERFGLDLLRGAVRSSSADSSRVLSPLSAGQALAVLLAAARDSTAILMERGLHLGSLSEESLAARSRRFNEAVRSRQDVTMKVANALWVDTSATLQPGFAQRARAEYAALVRTLPLSGPEVVPAINHWADSVTAGLIREVRDRPFDSAARVVITNAVYFKGLWLGPFDESLTRDRPFTSALGAQALVPTMERTAALAYRRGNGYQALRLPYRTGLSAMYIVLPDSGVRPAQLLDSLVAVGWPLPDPRSEAREVQVHLPRLHLAQATDLKSALQAAGLGIVFDSSRADFNGLVVPRPDQPPPCPPLSSGVHSDACTRQVVSSATQRVYLDVDEKGTEAAAVTTVEVVGVVTAVVEPIRFFVDRPFLFALRDERAGTLLFIGYIAGAAQ